MKKNVSHPFILALFVLSALSACKSKPDFLLDPPIPRFNPAFTQIAVDATRDSTYILENGTRITIPAGSLLDSKGNPITGIVNIRYRQFDNALSIFLAGLPMDYSYASPNMVLQTAGMFEIRCDDPTLTVNPDKPITITIGSNFTDPRQGFFKLNEETGQWTLIDIPDVKMNKEVELLKQKIDSLKPEWTIPLGPNFYVFDYTRMTDIFLGDDYKKIFKANLPVLSQRMKKYGVKELNIEFYDCMIDYKGNSYDNSEFLWKSDSTINPPSWVQKKFKWYYYPSNGGKEIKLFNVINIKDNVFLFEFKNIPHSQDKWSMQLELVSHLRNLVKYSPEELLAKQAKIEKEIEEIERKIRNSRMLEYTVRLYSMGVYNCDRPIFLIDYRPELVLELNGKPVKASNIKRFGVFNSDLSSVSYAMNLKPLTCPFFKGTNRILLVTEDSRLGLLTGKEFDQLLLNADKNSSVLKVSLTQVEVDSPEQLMELLKQ